MDKNLIQRTLSGLIYVLIIFFCTTETGSQLLATAGISVPPHYLFYGLLTFFAAICFFECFRILKFGKGYERFAAFGLAILVWYLFSKRFFGHSFFYQFQMFEIFGLALIAIAAVTVFRFGSELYYDNGKLIFAAVYSVLPLAFALGLVQFSSSQGSLTPVVFYLFLLIWFSDTFAYLVGKFFGKHKMAPKISPKKTWEGYIGGVIFTLLAGYVINEYAPEMRGNWMVIGLLVSLFAPIGDLMESQLKRNFGVKDSGNIIPGHGGLLDRLDSFLICAPVVYLYFIIDKLL